MFHFPELNTMVSVSGERSRLGRNPLDEIAQAHRVQVQVCDAMEKIADDLPDAVDRRLCAQVASCLQYDLPLHYLDEELGLFPLLTARVNAEFRFDRIAAQLSAEHQADSDFAVEVADVLDLLGQGARVGNAEMCGYMLRGFFERYRRHVHWENILVMPLARSYLTADDLVALVVLMEGNRTRAM